MKILVTLLVVLLSFPSVAMADEPLWQTIKQTPNIVVFVRNAESTGNLEGAGMLHWDSSGRCMGESTLTAVGKDQAKHMGEAFKKRGIRPFVISSPMCRCKETAQIAFKDFLTDPDLRQRPDSDPEGRALFLTATSKLLDKYRGNSPIVFVNHRPNIDALTMELITLGELLVTTRDQNGEIEVIGVIQLDK